MTIIKEEVYKMTKVYEKREINIEEYKRQLETFYKHFNGKELSIDLQNVEITGRNPYHGLCFARFKARYINLRTNEIRVLESDFNIDLLVFMNIIDSSFDSLKEVQDFLNTFEGNKWFESLIQSRIYRDEVKPRVKRRKRGILSNFYTA